MLKSGLNFDHVPLTLKSTGLDIDITIYKEKKYLFSVLTLIAGVTSNKNRKIILRCHCNNLQQLWLISCQAIFMERVRDVSFRGREAVNTVVVLLTTGHTIPLLLYAFLCQKTHSFCLYFGREKQKMEIST